MLCHVNVAAFTPTTTPGGAPPQFDNTVAQGMAAAAIAPPVDPNWTLPPTPRVPQCRTMAVRGLRPLRSHAPTCSKPQASGCTDSHCTVHSHPDARAQATTPVSPTRDAPSYLDHLQPHGVPLHHPQPWSTPAEPHRLPFASPTTRTPAHSRSCRQHQPRPTHEQSCASMPNWRRG
ncbi:hypothetical protein K439DRAFT_1640220 [Ramaria rubella]|nr:hypothetical protein K439DRAFT_1640220 [Ramaria rubella]